MLFIEHFSASMNLQTGGRFYEVYLQTNGTNRTFLLPQLNGVIGSFDFYTINAGIRAFANPGTSVTFSRTLHNATGATLSLSITGYYVDVP
jgi:hypothetical protein